MQWMNDREKQLATELGFVVRKGGRGGLLHNVSFVPSDTEHVNPREGNVRPATMAEAGMWRALMQGI